MTIESGKMDEEKGKEKNSSEVEKLLKAVSQQNEILKQQAKIIEEQSTRVEQLEKKLVNGAGSGFSPADLAAFGEAIIKAKAKSDDVDWDAGVQEEQIDPDDFFKEGVRFTSPKFGYCIVDDVRQGRRVKLPYNKKDILFSYAATRRVQQGKYETTTPFSCYISKSKREIEWLKSHSLFNVMFFETSTGGAVDADVINASKLATIMVQLKNYELYELISIAHQHNVEIHTDPAVLRSMVAMKMLKDQNNMEEETRKRQANESYNNALLSTQHEKLLRR